jgi:hypothetical protein
MAPIMPIENQLSYGSKFIAAFETQLHISFRYAMIAREQVNTPSPRRTFVIIKLLLKYKDIICLKELYLLIIVNDLKG